MGVHGRTKLIVIKLKGKARMAVHCYKQIKVACIRAKEVYLTSLLLLITLLEPENQ